MTNTEFGVSISDELVVELDELTEECVDLQASRSEVVEAILTAYFQSDVDHEARVRELIIRRRKGTL
jgi:metal-responsive CopG/Arc/MetJ family transcriptional regulator